MDKAEAKELIKAINGFTKIQQELPQAGADGGGHEVAGSLKFVEGLRDEVLELFIKEVKDLNRD